MRSFFLRSSLSVAVLLTVASPAAAFTPIVNGGLRPTAKPPAPAVRASTTPERVETVCAALEKRVDARIAAFDENKGRHATAYENLKTRVTAAVEKWTAAGYDTAALKADLVVLDRQIAAFAADYKAFIDQLKTTRGFACGKSNGQFVTNMATARTLLKKVQEDSAAIRATWQTKIRPDILALRGQIKEVTGRGDEADKTQ